MRQRVLGKTGLMVSEIGFGGWAIGGNAYGNSYGDTADDASRDAILRALDLGVSLFETADIYGHGHSEALISEVISTWDGPAPVIVTKGGVNFYRKDQAYEQDWTPYGIAHAVQQSLDRLRRNCIDVYLLMNPPVDDLDRWKVWETLESLRRAGKIAHYGASVEEPSDGAALIRRGCPVDVIEVAYSLFYQSAVLDLFPLARRHGVGILVREPLANGFLAGGSPDRIFDDGDIRGALPPEYIGAMHEMAGHLGFLSDATGRTPAQAAIRFALDADAACVVAGAKTRSQVEENVGAADVPTITDDERTRILEAFDQ